MSVPQVTIPIAVVHLLHIMKILSILLIFLMVCSVFGSVYALNSNTNKTNLTNRSACTTINYNESIPSNSSVIYVSLSGDDGGDGLTKATSKRTIQCAINTVANDGTVYVTNGTYHENLKIDKNVSLIRVPLLEWIIFSCWMGIIKIVV